ncbi:hypothetical protein N499_1223A, partial [Wolbachia pipientis wVitA]
MNIVYQIPD